MSFLHCRKKLFLLRTDAAGGGLALDEYGPAIRPAAAAQIRKPFRQPLHLFEVDEDGLVELLRKNPFSLPELTCICPKDKGVWS